MYDDKRQANHAAWLDQAEARVAWVQTWVPEGIVLEVGAATGEFLTVAGRNGYEAYGVEPSRWAATIAEDAGANVSCGTLDDWIATFGDFTVDAIAMFHVLEHLDTPLDVLADCRRILSHDGILFVEVPNAASRPARALDRSWTGWSFDFHHWHFTTRALETLLSRSGFEVVELHPMTWRPYTTSRAWHAVRAKERGVGDLPPSLDFVRIAARRCG